MKAATTEAINLLELKPLRNLHWEEREQGCVVLLIPKLKNRHLVKWLTPLLAKPNFRARLDTYGSFFWQQCDGNTTVLEIGERMKEKFHEPVEDMYDRIGKFVQKLVRDEFIILDAAVQHHSNGQATMTVKS